MQKLAGIGKLRAEPPARNGGPNGPVFPLPPTDRVSAIRQGASGKNAMPAVVVWPAWVTANKWPAITRAPLRLLPRFAGTVNDTAPDPVPDAPPVTVMKFEVLATLQEQPLVAVTFTSFPPAPALKLAL